MCRTMIKDIHVDALTRDFAREIPQLIQRYALHCDYNQEDDLVYSKKSYGVFAQTLKLFAVSYGLLAWTGRSDLHKPSLR